MSASNAIAAYKAARREYVGKAFLWTFPTFFVGAVPSAIHTAVVNTKMEGDFKDKSFIIEREIKVGASSQGFIWFQIPEKEISDGLLPKGMVLEIELFDGTGTITYELPLP